MSNFSKDKLTGVFAELGRKLIQPDEELTHLINTEKHHNAWFTAENVSMAIHAISDMLNETNIEKWLSRYELDVQKRRIKTGLVLAGNIPLVGFHDVLCVLITGNFPMIKAS
ncbi:MAG TPA: hypothetical protein VHA56_04200, partial [Mucilaginibacter sp.]|nr:hypothetical protein [Mucilaginibacter sp.]